MTFADLIKDFLNSSKERVKNPLSGSFLWSFIIFNWRPFLFLIFSDVSIENKIIIINHEYCSFWSLVVPLIFSILYTLLMPKITLFIDEILAETKVNKVNHIYKEKEHLIEKKTTLAGKEFLLKNAESGNKEIQDFADQINSLQLQNETLQQSLIQSNEVSKNTIAELNNKLKLANDTIIMAQSNNNNRENEELRLFNNLNKIIIGDTLHLDKQLAKEVLEVSDNMNYDDYRFLKSLNGKNTSLFIFNKTKSNVAEIDSLNRLKVINVTDSNDTLTIQLTDIGKIINEIIRAI